MKILQLIKEAIIAGARQLSACKVIGITPKTLQRWNASCLLTDRRTTRKAIPHNQLSKEERNTVLEAVNQSEYRELAPSQIVPLLADEGRYLASESTIYRLLRGNKADSASSKEQTSKFI